MEIKTISTMNFDKLYKVCCEKQNNDESKTGLSSAFGTNITALYEYIEIALTITDVNVYEAFMLKMTSSHTTPLSNKHFFGNMNAMMGAPKKYAALINSIYSDDSIPIKIREVYPLENGPAFFVHGDITVTYTGKYLINFLGLDPCDFFINATNGECIAVNKDAKEGDPIRFKDDFEVPNLNGYIASKFGNIFQQSALHRIEPSDPFSDKGISDNFLIRDLNLDPSKSITKLMAIRNPCLTLDFNNQSKEKQLELINSYKIMVPKYLTDNIYKSTRVEIAVYSNLANFFELYDILEKDMFIYNDSLALLSMKQPINIPAQLTSYETRITSRCEDINKNISEMPRGLMKYSYTYLNNMIAYTVNFSLEDVNLYINRVNRKNILESTSTILDNFIKYAKVAFNCVKK